MGKLFDLKQKAEKIIAEKNLDPIKFSGQIGLKAGFMLPFVKESTPDDPAKIDAAFWAGTRVKTNFICSLGRGDPSKVFQRNPRLSFEEACQLG